MMFGWAGASARTGGARRRHLLLLLPALVGVFSAVQPAPRAAAEHHFLYVAEPGIRNYVEYGGVGVTRLRHRRRLQVRPPHPDRCQVPAGQDPDNVKGIAASAATGRLYVTTIRRLMAFDLSTDKKVWEKDMPGGADRLAVSPDGKTLYVPTLEGPQWNGRRCGARARFARRW